MLRRIAATALALTLTAAPAFAQDGAERQAESLVNNTLKAFAYDWYSRFDRQVPFEELTPNLPDDVLEFVYPQATLTSLDDLRTQFQAALDTNAASSHEIEEIFVHPSGAESIYDIITPHTYVLARKDGTSNIIDIVSRMRVELADPLTSDPVIQGYIVKFEGISDAPATDRIAGNQINGITDNDAKSFVHEWFANTDARDADAMIALTATGPLGINLLGTEISSTDELKAYLELNSAAQSWAIHQPHNIEVRHTDEGFSVRFIVHFEGNIEGMGELVLTNVTNWLLVEQDGELRLRNYTLDLL